MITNRQFVQGSEFQLHVGRLKDLKIACIMD